MNVHVWVLLKVTRPLSGILVCIDITLVFDYQLSVIKFVFF